MDTGNNKPDQEDNVVTPEEKEAEEQALSEVKEEELRGKLAENLGIDPEDEPELLDKLVEREQSHHEKLSGAIKQKISWREKATTSAPKKPDNNNDGKGEPQGDSKDDKPLTEDRLSELLDEREAKRELERLDLPEEVATEVKDIAKVRGISVREALKLPYVTNRIEEVEREKRVQAATPKRGRKGSYVSSQDPSKPLDPDDFDLDTEEGRKEWQDAKAVRKKYLASQDSE